MGPEIRGISQDPPLKRAGDGSPDPDLSIGRYLGRQRRLRGVSLDDLAVLTRIPRRSLERLEDGAFDDQTDGFTRGFVRTVAEALGLDAEEAVMRLLGEPPGADEDARVGRQQLRSLAAAGALLALLAAAVAGLGVWLARGRAGPSGGDTGDIVYRRDAVRELAEQERASGGFSGPLDSGREGPPD